MKIVPRRKPGAFARCPFSGAGTIPLLLQVQIIASDSRSCRTFVANFNYLPFGDDQLDRLVVRKVWNVRKKLKIKGGANAYALESVQQPVVIATAPA